MGDKLAAVVVGNPVESEAKVIAQMDYFLVDSCGHGSAQARRARSGYGRQRIDVLPGASA